MGVLFMMLRQSAINVNVNIHISGHAEIMDCINARKMRSLAENVREINQLDHVIGPDSPTLRLALVSLMSKTDPTFPIFHSVDRSNYRESGICFQFLPQMAEEARMTISNLVPLLKYKYGPQVLKLFSPAAVERMEGCK